jgi:SAM-dependent methyltransferase
MGLGLLVDVILREQAHKPLHGDALFIGRQTVSLTRDEALAKLQSYGIRPAINPASIEIDTSTIHHRPGFESSISDVSFLRLLGLRNIRALDHSSYEKAEIIHDLRRPLPWRLRGSADIVIDGSTLDNVFTPATVLQNFARLLKPGGRLFMLNAGSPYDTAYVLTTPMWYVDYFVTNGFADCKVYVVVGDQMIFDKKNSNKKNFDDFNVFYVDLAQIEKRRREMGRFLSSRPLSIVVFAEKGPHSSWDKLPIQQDYRSPEDWKSYLSNVAAILQSKRPHLLASNTGRFISDSEVKGGHIYIASD